MDERIDLLEFLEQNFEGPAGKENLIDISDLSVQGTLMENGRIYLIPYDPGVDFLYHQGSFVGFNPEFDNLENLKNGYFGSKTGYTYLSTDIKVKPSMPLMDLCLKIDYGRLIKLLYRDPETFLKKFHYEWDRSFMIKGVIPKSAIVEISFPKNRGLIHELYLDSLDLDEYFEKIEQLRREFRILFE